MPDALADIVGSWSGAYFVRITADNLVPLDVFQPSVVLLHEKTELTAFCSKNHTDFENKPAATR